MTKRSMTHFNKQLQAAHTRGMADGYAKLWAELQLPAGVIMRDGRIARAVIEPAPIKPCEGGEWEQKRAGSQHVYCTKCNESRDAHEVDPILTTPGLEP